VKAGIFVTDVYKYTEKLERKKLKNRSEVQTPALPDTHPNPAFTKPLLANVFLFSITKRVNLKY